MFCLNCGEKSTALPRGAGKYRTVLDVEIDDDIYHSLCSISD